MSETVSSAVIAGLIAIVIWFGFHIAFYADQKLVAFVVAPISFAIAFGIGVFIGKRAEAKKSR